MIFTRNAVAEDRDFIVSGWSASLRSTRDIPLVPMALYADTFRPIITRHLDRCLTIVAHGETGVLFGFVAYDTSTYEVTTSNRKMRLDGYVLYVYVAAPFRRRGVARRLFAAAGISPTQRFGYACRTRSSWELRSKTPLAEYEPFRARYEEIEHGRHAAEAGVTEASATGTAEGARQDPASHDLPAR
jgi:hypothetical protein